MHSHPHEGNVYDFSRWTMTHPGNKVLLDNKQPNPITRFAQTGPYKGPLEQGWLIFGGNGAPIWFRYLGRTH